MYVIKNKLKTQLLIDVCDNPTPEQTLVIPPRATIKVDVDEDQFKYIKLRYKDSLIINLIQ